MQGAGKSAETSCTLLKMRIRSLSGVNAFLETRTSALKPWVLKTLDDLTIAPKFQGLACLGVTQDFWHRLKREFHISQDADPVSLSHLGPALGVGFTKRDYMSYSLNSLKGLYMGLYLGLL